MHAIIYFIIILSVSSLLYGCNSNDYTTKQKSFSESDLSVENGKTVSGTEDSINTDAKFNLFGPLYELEPLNDLLFNSIINNTAEFRIILVNVSFNHSTGRYLVYFDCGDISNLKNLNNEIFNAQMNSYVNSHDPYFLCYYQAGITRIQMDPIFDLLINSSAYFFNNEEFTGLTIPYEPQYLYFSKKNYNFSIFVVDSVVEENIYHGYAISKSVDELSPDPPLYDLFQLIETEYVPMMMQHEEDCW